MSARGQKLSGKIKLKRNFAPTEMGSAHFVDLGHKETISANRIDGDAHDEASHRGPPWGVQPSLPFLCDEVGVDFSKFVHLLSEGKNEMEIATELTADPKIIKNLCVFFYQAEAISGNYGQD